MNVSTMSAIFKSKLYWLLMAFCFSLVLTRALFVPATDDRGRGFFRGDGPAEQGSLSAANYWLDFGYTSTYFRAMFFYKGGGDTTGIIPYTHYQPSGELATSLYMRALGTRSEPAVRVAATFVSFLFVLALTFLVQWLLRDRRITLVCLALILPTNYFLAWADNLFSHQLAEMAKVVFVSLIFLHYHQKKSPWSIWPFALACFVLAQSSPPAIIFCAAVAVGFSVAYKKGVQKVFAVENILLGLGFVAGVAFHIYLNRLYYGSWEACFADLSTILEKRGSLPFAERLAVFPAGLQRIERFFMLPWWAMIVAHYFYLQYFKNRPEMKALSWILLSSGLVWLVVMAQHASIHSFTARELGLYVMLVGGVGSWAYSQFVRQHWTSWDLKYKFINGFFIVAATAMGITQQAIPMWWKHSLSRIFS